MRVYLENKKPLDTINLLSLAKYQTAKKHFTRFYTNNGIFNKIHNSIYKVNIIDRIISSTKINCNENILDVIMDESQEIIDENMSYQLPYGYITQNITEATYRLAEHSQQKLVVLFNEELNIMDFYFEINQPIDCYEVIYTISTFLSIL